MTKYSVLMAFYGKDDPTFLKEALTSLVDQTCPPDEIVLVQDGPVPEVLSSVVKNFPLPSGVSLQWTVLEQNRGLGPALDHGLRLCRHSLVGRMDADDVSMPHRFETQVNYMEAHPEVDVLGSWINEFSERTDQVETVKTAPPREKIYSYSRLRNPMNHPTVMMRKDRILAAGSYGNFPGFEDFELWMRLIHLGYVLENLQEPLLFFRKNQNFLLRRKGAGYARGEKYVFGHLKKQGYLESGHYVYGVLLRGVTRLMPSWMLKGLYNRLLRKGG